MKKKSRIGRTLYWIPGVGFVREYYLVEERPTGQCLDRLYYTVRVVSGLCLFLGRGLRSAIGV